MIVFAIPSLLFFEAGRASTVSSENFETIVMAPALGRLQSFFLSNDTSTLDHTGQLSISSAVVNADCGEGDWGDSESAETEGENKDDSEGMDCVGGGR